MMELTRRGPIHKNAKLVHDLASDTSKTGIVMTCLPESMPVSETLHLHSELTASGYEISAVVLNEMLSVNLPDADAWKSISTALHTHDQQPTIDLVERFFARDEQQNAAQATLSQTISAPMYTLPLLVDARIQANSIDRLSRYFDQRPEPQ
jgi:anion-transporting  ArsA/GET3 family ATPase